MAEEKEPREKQQCQKCGRTFDASLNFYKRKNGTYQETCKKCVTLHVDPWDKNTFTWILKDLDIPYVENKWEMTRDREYAVKGPKLSPTAIFGKYVAKMKLKEWYPYGWEDTERLAEIDKEKQDKKKKEQEEYDIFLKEQYEAGNIPESQYRTLVSSKTLREDDLEKMESSPESFDFGRPSKKKEEKPMFFNEHEFLPEEELIDSSAELTQDDKLYLALKWGRLYKADEWIALEKTYKEMEEGFDIQDPDTQNTLILLCKVNLKMNQAIDCGDLDGAAKTGRLYDSLRKSAKFTAAQKKEQQAGEFDSVGQIVRFAESRKGGGKIGRHQVVHSLDVVDESLEKIKNYYQTLIKNDPNIAQQIENYIKKREIMASLEKDKEEAKRQGLSEYQITDKDILDAKEAYDREVETDESYLKSLAEGDFNL